MRIGRTLYKTKKCVSAMAHLNINRAIGKRTGTEYTDYHEHVSRVSHGVPDISSIQSFECSQNFPDNFSSVNQKNSADDSLEKQYENEELDQVLKDDFYFVNRIEISGLVPEICEYKTDKNGHIIAVRFKLHHKRNSERTLNIFQAVAFKKQSLLNFIVSNVVENSFVEVHGRLGLSKKGAHFIYVLHVIVL